MLMWSPDLIGEWWVLYAIQGGGARWLGKPDPQAMTVEAA